MRYATMEIRAVIDYKEKAKHFLFDFCAGGDAIETADEGLARMEKELRELVATALAEGRQKVDETALAHAHNIVDLARDSSMKVAAGAHIVAAELLRLDMNPSRKED